MTAASESVAFTVSNGRIPSLPSPQAMAALEHSLNKANANAAHGATSRQPGITAAALMTSAGVMLTRSACRQRKARRRHRKGMIVTAAADSTLIVEEFSRPRSETVLEMAQKSNMNLVVKPWELLSGIAKDAARSWFVKRAEERGIPWSESVEGFEAQQSELDVLYQKICNPKIEYPSYYTQAFHGYDEGNLTWRAAHELEAATQSMCLGYYDGTSWQDAQERFRGAARKAIADKWHATHGSVDDALVPAPSRLLDVGCSGGFSTNEMTKAFPGVDATGLDLSPYFLAVAKNTYPNLNFVHGLAEDTGLPDSSFEVVTLNFICHELPLETSCNVIHEAYRVLKPGGLLAILDVDPRRLLELPPLRRWAFQVTEPWCKEGEYYSFSPENTLSSIGFEDVEYLGNDPVNALVLAVKPKNAPLSSEIIPSAQRMPSASTIPAQSAFTMLSTWFSECLSAGSEAIRRAGHLRS